MMLALVACGGTSIRPTAENTITQGTTPTARPTETVSQNETSSVTPTEPAGEVAPTVTPTETPEVTESPIATPTAEPTEAPVATPTEEPVTPTAEPAATLIPSPTEVVAPTAEPTVAPTATPTATPTVVPTKAPTATPTVAPTVTPTVTPTPVPVVTELTAGKYAKILFNLINIPLADDTYTNAYETALNYGFLTESMAPSAEYKLLRKDAFVMLANVAEYIGVYVDEDILVNVVERERISDLSGTGMEKQAMQYLLATGIVEGKADGTCSKTRSFEPKKKISSKDAQTYAERLVKESLRAKISPDGQVCRTTNLPKYARFFPYILESYPNEYYDYNFEYMRTFSWYPTGELDEYGDPIITDDNCYYHWKDGDEYYSPANMGNFKSRLWEDYDNFTEVWSEMGADFEKQVEDHLMLIFNVDYRTTPNDAAWRERVMQTLNVHEEAESARVSSMDKYLKAMKENKAVVTCDRVSADLSSLYYSEGNYLIRTYVHYKIDSAASFSEKGESYLVFVNELGANHQNYKNAKLGEWREGFFEVKLNIDEGWDRIVVTAWPFDSVNQGKLVAE